MSTAFLLPNFDVLWQHMHGIARSYSWVKNTLQAAGKVARAPKRSAHRKKRARRPQEGMLLLQSAASR